MQQRILFTFGPHQDLILLQVNTVFFPFKIYKNIINLFGGRKKCRANIRFRRKDPSLGRINKDVKIQTQLPHLNVL